MEGLEVDRPRKKTNPAIITAFVVLAAIAITTLLYILLVDAMDKKGASLEKPSGWYSSDRQSNNDWEQVLKEEGYEQEVDFEYFTSGWKRGFGMTHYVPQETDAFRDLPDTKDTEEMEAFIQSNEASLLEYADTRFSTPAEVNAVRLECGQSALTIAMPEEEKELILFRTGGKVYCVYVVASEEDMVTTREYVIENLKVE